MQKAIEDLQVGDVILITHKSLHQRIYIIDSVLSYKERLIMRGNKYVSYSTLEKVFRNETPSSTIMNAEIFKDKTPEAEELKKQYNLKFKQC